MPATVPTPTFGPGALRFLRALARNNRKPWFEANRERYERELRAPMRALIEEMDTRFGRFAPEITGDPRRSMFRIHRDVRFSRDKSPYKTHAACWFHHRDATRQVGQESESGSAGFYFHLQPDQCFLGAGLWMPPRGQLGKIRDAMAEKPAAFLRIVNDRTLSRRYGGLDDDAVLKRMPRGYPDDHPVAGWLKYQSFTMGRSITDAQATGRALPKLLEQDYERLLPLVRWLNGALGMERRSAKY